MVKLNKLLCKIECARSTSTNLSTSFITYHDMINIPMLTNYATSSQNLSLNLPTPQTTFLHKVSIVLVITYTKQEPIQLLLSFCWTPFDTFLSLQVWDWSIQDQGTHSHRSIFDWANCVVATKSRPCARTYWTTLFIWRTRSYLPICIQLRYRHYHLRTKNTFDSEEYYSAVSNSCNIIPCQLDIIVRPYDQINHLSRLLPDRFLPPFSWTISCVSWCEWV